MLAKPSSFKAKLECKKLAYDYLNICIIQSRKYFRAVFLSVSGKYKASILFTGGECLIFAAYKRICYSGIVKGRKSFNKPSFSNTGVTNMTIVQL